ncbi:MULTISPECIES: DUF4278 domain-containing protein [Cyanophyceae]|uniref:DUF4278 domain-containing protein n=1 Tax=Pseudocalidococcus azoricus BACA0444 TaxID=2918990 RepID=A0AAE4K0B9_9CYAN|nr:MULTISPECIES: DUF4278 domain-containing protein [Cyanophyceae]AFY60155.1 hypothetical protein Syn6312_0953 [Synechococcus sp. PCC 6312]MDS3861792.1 DUF4278 domain-containing protein [Pseudocalidococcus azoricus BACA0444]
MKLTYRGVTYEVNPAHLNVKETAAVAHYRGAEYHPHQALNPPAPKDQGIVYRGAEYHPNLTFSF